MIFELAGKVSTYIGLASFIVACFFWLSHAKLRHQQATADQFNDEEKKLLFLQGLGMLPANWASIGGKDALRLAEIQMRHRRKILLIALVFFVFIFLLSITAFVASTEKCRSEISYTGSGSTNVGCAF